MGTKVNRMVCRGPIVSVDEKTGFRTRGVKDKKTGELKPCNFDITHIIEELPEDGEDHIVKCPVCDNEISVMRTPPE